MASKAKTYTRLTRDSSGVGTYSSLWLAADHLMVVTASGISENYARVDLRDIQGFFLTPTKRRMAWAIGWGAIAATSLIVILMSLGSRNGPAFSVFFLILALGAMLWNHLLSPGCAVYVITSVQTARIVSLRRRRQTRKILARLEPLIRAAQADLVPPPAPTPVAPTPAMAPPPAATEGTPPAEPAP